MLLWHPAYRRREFTSGSYKEREKLSSRCQGKTSSRSAFKKESTNAWHGGRNFRSSDEALVMSVEQRGSVIRLSLDGNSNEEVLTR